MRGGRLLIVVAFLIIVGAIGVVVLLPMLQQQQATPGTGADDGGAPIVQELPTATPIPFVEIVIAIQELPRGTRIPANGVDLVRWPEVSAPFNAVTNLEDVIGKIARTDIFREQPITTTIITDDFDSLAEVGSDAAAITPNGLVSIALPIDRLSSVAYGIQDGDRVDVIVSMLFVDVDDIFQTLVPNLVTFFIISEDGIETSETIQGRLDITSIGSAIVGPTERQRPRLSTQRTIQDALVIHVGEFPADGKFIGIVASPTPVQEEAEPEEQELDAQGEPVATPTPVLPSIVTLAVTPQDAVVLAWIIEARLPVTLALRSAGDASRSATQAVTLDYMVENYGINPPPKRQYSIEPAIRSIRQLLTDEDIQLSDFAASGGG
jgi:pilus assembly protein CpaB